MDKSSYRYDDYKLLSTEELIRKESLSYHDQQRWISLLTQIRNKPTFRPESAGPV